MELLVPTFVVIVLAFGAMALGVIAGRDPLERGCGRLSCEGCARPCARHDARRGDGR
ncbi:MAG TPA: hypothetical protein VKB65_11650 [Myxococcota bacterium]|nr:hypothetical protein [Myxococcota bacterium]